MYLVFLTTNLFDTLVADKKDSYLFIHVFRTKRVIYLAQIKQNGRVDAKNTLSADVFIFLNYYYYWLCFSDSLWQRRGSEVPSSELYIKPWAGFILSWVFWERSSGARITQKMFETIKNPYKTQKSWNRKEVTGSRYTLLPSFLNELKQTLINETFASWDITRIWWCKVTCHALTFTRVSVAWVLQHFWFNALRKRPASEVCRSMLELVTLI